MIPSSVTCAFLVLALGLAADARCQPVAVANAPTTPTPRFTFGFEERFRGEWWDNLADHDDSREDGRKQYRFRTRLWGDLALGARAAVSVGMVTETRKVTLPSTDFTFDEFLFEQALLTYRFDRAWTARLGRQNLQRGDGFVLWDGTPLDGSRSAYFNAAVLTRAFRGATLDVIATYTARTDEFLPRIHEAAVARPIADANEAGVGGYWSGRVRAGKWDGYVLTKRATGDLRAPSAAAFIPDRTVTAFGTRTELSPHAGWLFSGEIVGEVGRQDATVAGGRSARIGAWGGYARLRRQFVHRLKPTVEIGCTGLSGDDPTTPDIEGFDPMFARWPRESELMTNAMAIEYRPAYWTNQHALQAAAQASPFAHLSLRAAYFHIGAYAPFHRRGTLFGDGLDRGDLWQARADWNAAPHWRGHVLYEHFSPGDFYASRDAGYFFRVETTFVFTKRW